MTDITSEHLEAALIDQMVAGKFHNKVYVFTVAYNTDISKWMLGVAVANEAGYHLVEGKTFEKQNEAKQWADGLNEHIGRDEDSVLAILGSTMRGGRVEIV